MSGFQKSIGVLALALIVAQASTAWAVIFTPPVTSGLVIQYDGSNYNATSGVWTNSGSYSGANTTAPGGNIPSASTLGGEPAVHFAASTTTDNTYRLTASYSTSNPFTTSATVFIVAKNAANGVFELLQSSGRTDDYTSFNGALYEGLFRNARLEAAASGMPGTNSASFIYEVDSSSSYAVYLNGNTKYSSATPGTTFAAGTGFIIGLDGVNLGAFNGDIAQILIYNTTLSDTQRNLIGHSLASYYGVGASIYPAPEPASMSLLAIGGLLLLKRRRVTGR